MEEVFEKPVDFERATALAYSMFNHVARAGQTGVPFHVAFYAIAVLNGYFIAGAYDDQAEREKCALRLASAAVKQASFLEDVPCAPYGAQFH